MCFYSRQAGHRFGEHLEKIVPPIMKFCQEEDDELREYCLQAFESFVRRCPKEITPFVTNVSVVTHIGKDKLFVQERLLSLFLQF